MDIRNGNRCILVRAALSAGPLVGIRLSSGEAQATVQLRMRPDQRAASLLMLGLPINPVIPAACTEVLAACSFSREAGSRDAPSAAHRNPFSKHFFSPPSDLLVSYELCFFSPALSLQGLARLLA